MDAHSRRPVVRVIGTVLAMLAAVAAVAGSAAATMTDSPAGVADKVDPAVLAAFDSHAEATFWVVLRDRANLRPAARSKGHLHGHRERCRRGDRHRGQ